MGNIIKNTLSELSVPAKLHSTLVDYVKKRPNMIIKFLKQETDEECSLSDETDEQRAQRWTPLWTTFLQCLATTSMT